MVMEKEMDRFDTRNLEAVYGVPEIFLWSKELFDTVNRHKAAQPVPFIVVTDDKPDVTVTGLVTTLSLD
jgi:hypothetical protein